MNKFFIFLAFVAFVAFALLACSNEPAPSHADLCAKKPITKECLAGKWYLERVIRESGNNDGDCNHKGKGLNLKKNGEFSFEGGVNNIETNGTWKLNEAGTEMTIECRSGDCTENVPYVINAEIELKDSDLRVISKGYTSFSQCKLEGNSATKLIEVFSWQTAN